MPTEIVHLQEPQPLTEEPHILHQLILMLDIVDQTEIELRPRRHTFDLARIRCRCNAVDRILPLHLADVGIQLHRAEAVRRSIIHAKIIELQTGQSAARLALRCRAEQAADLGAVLRHIMQDIPLRHAARKQRAQLPLERAAGNDRPLRHRIAQERTVHRADRREIRGCPDVQPRLKAQSCPNIQFSLECALLLHRQSLPP